MRNFLITSASLIALAAASGTAIAQNEELPETVVVTATRIPTPEAKIASSITVITAKDIAAKQQQTLPDVLSDVPGLNVVQTGGAGGQASVFMRGTNSNHVKVLVDGIDVSDPSNPTGTFDFGQFLTPDIDRLKSCAGRKADFTAPMRSAASSISSQKAAMVRCRPRPASRVARSIPSISRAA